MDKLSTKKFLDTKIMKKYFNLTKDHYFSVGSNYNVVQS